MPEWKPRKKIQIEPRAQTKCATYSPLWTFIGEGVHSLYCTEREKERKICWRMIGQKLNREVVAELIVTEHRAGDGAKVLPSHPRVLHEAGGEMLLPPSPLPKLNGPRSHFEWTRSGKIALWEPTPLGCFALKKGATTTQTAQGATSRGESLGRHPKEGIGLGGSTTWAVGMSGSIDSTPCFGLE